MNDSTQPDASQFITFRLGDELFAINVSQVREVLDLSLITRVPTAPDYMRGVVNVRGTAFPVVDLRAKFGLPRAPDSVQTRIIVLELVLDGESTVLGGLADSVHEVIELEPAQVADAPRIGMRWRTDLIQGIGKRGDQFIIILDIAKVFTLEEVALATAAPVESA